MSNTGNYTSINSHENEKFEKMAHEWWDPHGKFKPLHQLHPARMDFITRQIACYLNMHNDHINTIESLSILDIGCGGGLIAESLTKLGAKVTAIDANETTINIAKSHASKMGLNITYNTTTVEELLQKQGSAQYDVILALEIIEHIDDIPRFMSDITALAKPSSLQFYSTINRTFIAWFLAIFGAEYVMQWLPKGTHEYKKFVQPSELLAMARALHLQPHAIEGLVYNFFNGQWSCDTSKLQANYIASFVQHA